MAKKSLSFLEEIEERFNSYLKTDEEKDNIVAISTDSVSLDFSTGIGGIPIGRFTEIYGPESSGKTTLCLTVAKNAINMGGKVLYIDAENGLSWDYIKSIAPNATRENFILLQPSYAEEAFILAQQGIESKEFNLIVYDSLVALSTKSVQEDDFEKGSVATLPRVISKFIGRVTYPIRDSGTAFVFINQVRDKIGAYVPTLESPGGHSIKHSCSLRIQLTSDLTKDGKIIQGDEIIGNYCKFVIKKNKLGPPLRSYSFPLIYGKGIDKIRDLVVFAEILGVITRAGAWYSFEGNNIGQGLLTTIDNITNNKDLLDKISTLVYNMMNKENTLKGELDE